MKKKITMVLFAILTLFIVLGLVACTGNGETVDSPTSQEIGSAPYVVVKDNVYFGSYPQSIVLSSSTTQSLNEIAKTPNENADWTAYEYYDGGNVAEYMWYIDLSLGDKEYRGVYIGEFRPYDTTKKSSAFNSDQDDNAYKTGQGGFLSSKNYKTKQTYWFEKEPIRWKILNQNDCDAFIVCDFILDSLEFCATGSAEKVNHNGGVGFTNDYELSGIRKWLNETFYETAFNALEKEFILKTTVENGAVTTNPKNDPELRNEGKNEYATAGSTQDYVFLLSEQEVTDPLYGFEKTYNKKDSKRKKTVSDYAQCQGADVGGDEKSDQYGWWWLRSASDQQSDFARGVYANGSTAFGYAVTRSRGGVVPALNIKLHDFGEQSTVAPTCEEEGYDLHTCTRCGATYKDKPTDPIGHAYLFNSFEWDENYNAQAKYVCRHDATHEEYYDAEEITSSISTPATATNKGVKTYVATYDKKTGRKEEAEYRYILDSFEWDGVDSAKAKFVRDGDLTHVEYYDATVTSSVTKKPTCTEKGERTYVAGYGVSMDTKTEEIPETGHEYVFDSFVWDEDYNAQARYVCKHDTSHIVYYEAVVTNEVTKEATCTEKGERTHTATYDGKEDTKTEVIPETGHEYVFDSFVWDEDFNAQARYVCEHDASHIVYYEAIVTNEVTKEATCTEKGERTYTATYDGKTGTVKEEIDMIDHEYEDGRCVVCGADEPTP